VFILERVLCSTNEDLPKLIREGRFREDLYYRINVVELRIPPLRERREDIAPLCERFIDQANQENGYAITGLEPEALKLLERCPWPGNVRELEHAVQRAAVRAKAAQLLGIDRSRLYSRLKKYGM
jgi:two-component system NtrC family response regulator